MRIKLDEMLPAALVDILSDLSHDVETVQMEKLSGAPDDTIWDAAGTENRFLISQDLDFSDVRKFAPGDHPGILIVRLRRPGRKALTECIASFFKSDDAVDLDGCFVVLTERKARIRRPKSSHT
jgi:predicted nuclease of predicted toxin-antitoxin system